MILSSFHNWSTEPEPHVTIRAAMGTGPRPLEILCTSCFPPGGESLTGGSFVLCLSGCLLGVTCITTVEGLSRQKSWVHARTRLKRSKLRTTRGAQLCWTPPVKGTWMWFACFCRRRPTRNMRTMGSRLPSSLGRLALCSVFL